MAVEWENGIPILTGESLLSDVPEYTLELSQMLGGGSVAPVGAITAFAGANAPEGWLLCDASYYSTALYPVLWGVLGYTYGGSGDYFNVPDLRGRTIAGQDRASSTGSPAPNRLTTGVTGSPAWDHATSATKNGGVLGSWTGVDRLAITIFEMPSHNHDHPTFGVRGDTNASADNGFTTTIASHEARGGGRQSASNGHGHAHQNVQPTLILNWIIKHDYPES